MYYETSKSVRTWNKTEKNSFKTVFKLFFSVSFQQKRKCKISAKLLILLCGEFSFNFGMSKLNYLVAYHPM